MCVYNLRIRALLYFNYNKRSDNKITYMNDMTQDLMDSIDKLQNAVRQYGPFKVEITKTNFCPIECNVKTVVENIIQDSYDVRAFLSDLDIVSYMYFTKRNIIIVTATLSDIAFTIKISSRL